MADFQVDGPELKKMIAVMRRQPIAFAFNPAKKDADHYLGLDRRKAPDVLGRDAKKNGEGGKAAFGMASINSKVMSLRCEKFVPGMAKKLKKYLKTQSLSYNIEILDESGAVLEADITDLPDDPEDMTDTPPQAEQKAENTDQETAPTSEPAVDVSDLLARLNTCKPQVQAADQEQRKALMPLFTGVATALQAKDGTAAADQLNKLEKALAELPPPQATQNTETGLSRKDVQEAFVGLVGRVKALPESQSAKLDPHVKQAAEMLKAGELEKTQAAITKISTAIDTLEAQTGNAAPDTKALADQAKSLRDQITALSDAETQGALMADLAASVGHIKSGDLAAAAEALNALADAVQNAAAPSDDPDEIAYKAMWPNLVPLVDAEITPKGPMSTGLNAAKMAAEDAAKAGDFAKALLIAKRLEEKLPDAKAARLAADKATAGTQNSVNFAITRLNWGKARKDLRAEMQKVADAIVAELKGGDIEGIETAVTDLFGYLDPINEALEDELDRLINATEPAQIATLRDACLGIIGTFRQELNQGIFNDIDSNNGFADVAVQKNALSALDAVANDIEQAAKAA